MEQPVGGATLFLWRAHDGGEVDVLIELGGAVVGVEIKAGHRVDAPDLKGLPLAYPPGRVGSARSHSQRMTITNEDPKRIVLCASIDEAVVGSITGIEAAPPDADDPKRQVGFKTSHEQHQAHLCTREPTPAKPYPNTSLDPRCP